MGASSSLHPTGFPLDLERSLMLMSIQGERKTLAPMSHDSTSIAARLWAWRPELHQASQDGLLDADACSWTAPGGRRCWRQPTGMEASLFRVENA